MKKLFFTLILTLGLCCSCSNDDTPSVPDRPIPNNIIELESRVKKEISETGNNFANKFMLEMNRQVSNQNMMISPMSLQIALGMLSNGADEEALQEITNVLGLNNYSLEIMNSYYYALSLLLEQENNDFTLKLANAIWIQEDYPVGETFIENNRAVFNATIEDIDFGQAEKAKKKINQWASKATAETIKELSCDINSSVRVLLANACYMKGAWTLPFNKTNTQKADFICQDGSSSQVDMMGITNYFNYRDNASETYRMVELPYSDQSFSMVIALPKDDMVLDEVLPLVNWNCDLTGTKVTVQLPKFKIEASYPDEVKRTVDAMGIKRIFSTGALPGINEELFVGQITQDTYIAVDEEGTEASAVTTIVPVGNSGPNSEIPETPVIKMDSPFAFAIRENTTGTVLFLGKIVKM